MISKALEAAILTLQAVADNTTITPDPASSSNGTSSSGHITDGSGASNPNTTNPVLPGGVTTDQIQAISGAILTIGAFVYLGLGVAYTFFGAKFVQLFISLLFGLLIGSIPVTIASLASGGSISTGVTIASICLFGIASFGCWHAHKTHAVILGVGVGTYVGSVAWALLASYYTAPAWKFVFEAIAAIIFGWYGYHHPKKFIVHATAFLGANMIATSITLFTNDSMGVWGNLGVQVACIVVFGYAGHEVQHKLGFEKAHLEEKLHDAENKGHFVEHRDEGHHEKF